MATNMQDFPYIGELAALTAALIWAGTMTAFGAFTSGLSANFLNLYKCLVAVLCLVVTCFFSPAMTVIDGPSFLLLSLSGVVGIALGDTALFAVLGVLGTLITSALQCLAPPIAALLAVVFLGESLNFKEIIGLVLTVGAILGVIYAGRRDGAQLSALTRGQLAWGLAGAVLAAFCQGVGIVLSRSAFQHVPVAWGTLTRVASATLALALFMAFTGGFARQHWQALSPRRAVIIAVAAFMGTFIGMLLIAFGVKHAKAGIVAALSATYPIWLVPLARYGLKEKVSRLSAVCAAVAVCGVVLMLS